MIQIFIDRFINNKTQLESAFRKQLPESYAEIVKSVIPIISSDDPRDIDPERIHEIDDGEYQGTLIYVIGAKGYQPYTYWYVRVEYGSCSDCDTLEGIRGYSKEQVTDYMTLALHIVEGLHRMCDEEEDCNEEG